MKYSLMWGGARAVGGISGILVVYRQHGSCSAEGKRERERENLRWPVVDTYSRWGGVSFFVVIRRRPHEHEDRLMHSTTSVHGFARTDCLIYQEQWCSESTNDLGLEFERLFCIDYKMSTMFEAYCLWAMRKVWLVWMISVRFVYFSQLYSH